MDLRDSDSARNALDSAINRLHCVCCCTVLSFGMVLTHFDGYVKSAAALWNSCGVCAVDRERERERDMDGLRADS